jgi:hypothetical protein
VSGDEGANRAVLRAFDQALPDATDRRTERRGGMWWVPPWGRKCGGEDLVVGKILQEDHEFIVTRATTAIALHLLRTDPPSDTAVSLGSDHPCDL